jgi:hypothetical protein
MAEALRMLIVSFDCMDGLPEQTFNSAVTLIGELLGNDAAGTFATNIDATDGKFYVRENLTGARLAEMVFEVKDADVLVESPPNDEDLAEYQLNEIVDRLRENGAEDGDTDWLWDMVTLKPGTMVEQVRTLLTAESERFAKLAAALD